MNARIAVSLKPMPRLQKFSTRTRREAAYLAGAAFGHRRAQRFVLVSHARTGSNYIVNGLTTSRTIRMYRELFADHNRVHGRGFGEVMNILDSRQPRSVRFVGFKLFYYHLTPSEWSSLVNEDFFGFIHLTRRNRLRTVVSLSIASKTDRWTGGGRTAPLARRRVWLDPNALVARLDEIARYEDWTRDHLCDHRVLEVTYEDIVANPSDGFARIGAFLGVGDIDPRRIVLSRQNPEPLAALIVNYDDVVACLAGTRHAEDVFD